MRVIFQQKNAITDRNKTGRAAGRAVDARAICTACVGQRATTAFDDRIYDDDEESSESA